MEFNYDKCPECGYVNKKQPDICPSCGCNLREYRKQLDEQQESYRRESEEKQRLAQLDAKYNNAVLLFSKKEIDRAKYEFLLLGNYKDSCDFVEKCNDYYYTIAVADFNSSDYLSNLAQCLASNSDGNISDIKKYVEVNFSSIDTSKIDEIKWKFEKIIDFKDSTTYISHCKKAKELYEKQAVEVSYLKAIDCYNDQDFRAAKEIFEENPHYKDSPKYLTEIKDILDKQQAEEDRIAAEKQAEEDKIAAARWAEHVRLTEIMQAKERKRQRIRNILHATEGLLLLLALISPILASVIFGVILFSNFLQIGIVSSAGAWCAAWVFFTIADMITSIIMLKKLFKAWNISFKVPRIAGVILISITALSCFVTFSNSADLEPDFDPTTFISFEVDNITTNVGYSSYESTISFTLRNTSNVDVSYIYGEMTMYNGDDWVGTWNVYFSGDYKAGNSSTTRIEFTEMDTADLYNTPYENLGITYRITTMRFGDDWDEYTFNGKVMTLKTGRASHKDDYAPEDNSLASRVKKFAGNNAILPDDYQDTSEGVAGVDVTSYYNWKHYSAFYIMFLVPDRSSDTFVDDFIAKLIDNGYTLMSHEMGFYEYIKDYTVIRFTDDVHESKTWNGEEYENQYYYLDYYAYEY